MYRYICGLYESRKIPVGAKIWFEGEKQGYTVRASNAAFCICTKPFNARKTTLYCIIDWEQKIRGPENLVFGFGAETDDQCWEMLERVTNNKSEVSSRHDAPLKIVKYWHSQLSKAYAEPSVSGPTPSKE